ncbi:MAG: response regulator [Pseudomonadota bacterium]|uniref:CheY-like chemotaxis protein n=1 Tax=Actibacterium naphthalenivorans TaxID=1614693 RepID=A0A840CAV1_9RHOB|nr:MULTISPECIES: response regulator [Actibacterium]ALG91824.1 chemotaxis protein CheY [Actibacterium sp. EMB200-NS6]KGB83416.1 chemotaxis protein CheY [Rhodovulum sp. NI22]MBB4020479.1 CheY-like chemotaxis protein [Actibacterium naphthalenivorans]MDY6859444.1 response regulator [Pseudomonadota bacterium]
MSQLEKILHVDDDTDIQFIVKMSLETVGGFTVEQCSSGHEALACAAGFQPDLVLLDLMMPVMDGEETFQELRKLDGLQDTPVIFVTAKAHDASVKDLISKGALDVVTKPFDPMTLPDIIREAWEKA